jgi:hypothetical protein
VPNAAAAGTAESETATPTDNAINSLALARAVAPSLVKRYAPALVGVAAGVAVGFLLGRRKRTSPAVALGEDLQAALLRLVS